MAEEEELKNNTKKPQPKKNGWGKAKWVSYYRFNRNLKIKKIHYLLYFLPFFIFVFFDQKLA